MHQQLSGLLIVVLLFGPMPGEAEIYKWVDEQGRLHFTDQPPADQNSMPVELKINTYTSPEITASPFTAPEDKSTGKRVVLYSTAWCKYCKKARQYFTANGIAFQEYDVETTARGRKDYAALGGNGVPIILIGDKRLNGFSAESFARLYAPR